MAEQDYPVTMEAPAMPDREKVIKGLESLRGICIAKSDMAIGEGRTAWAGYASVVHLALDLLREQEPVKPRVGHDGWYRCGGCNNSLASGERVKHFYGHPWPKYCEECGKKVGWE